MREETMVFLERLRLVGDDARSNIKVTEASKKQREYYTALYDEAKQTLQDSVKSINFCKKCIKALDKFSAEKKAIALASIKASIALATEIIPNKETIELKLDVGKAWLENGLGQLVSHVEGSGFKAFISFFTRRAILASTDYLQFLFLDEPLSTVSVENSLEFSRYLPILSDNMVFILTEQKNEIFDTVQDMVVYSFERDTATAEPSKVERTVYRNGKIIGGAEDAEGVDGS